MLLARLNYAWLPLACLLVPLLTSCSSSQSTRRAPTPDQTRPAGPAITAAAPAAVAPAARDVPMEPATQPPSVPTRPAVDPAAAPVVARLAAQLLLEPEAIVVASVETAQWPDACLGLPAEGEICAMAVTPGFAVTLVVGIDRYEFRTDATGEKIRVSSAPPARTGEPLVTWKDAQSFNMLIIGTQRVAIGRRGRPLIASPLVVPARATELQDLLARFAPFQVQTPVGEIALRGVGATRATETEQRMIAEWARLVSLEAREGREQPAANVALRWRGANGAAAGSDTIEVTRTGFATATNERGGQATVIASLVLRAEELTQLYAWLDRFEAFEQQRPSGEGAESAFLFRGNGVDEASDADRAAVIAWVDGLARRLRETALAPTNQGGSGAP
ncbi:MAG: hypothetical protein IAE82_10020 [Opitutaceae bacterium]|nr:hypothetical protein [Opitutaceae bacterium]